MKTFRLFQLVLSKAEDGLWYDHDERSYDPKGWGIALRFFAGHVVRPYTRPKFWFKTGIPSKWNSFHPTFHGVIKFWLPIAPFLSISLGRFGFYIGFKIFSLEPLKYVPMVGPNEVYDGSSALTPSITTRRSRWN